MGLAVTALALIYMAGLECYVLEGLMGCPRTIEAEGRSPE